MNNLKTENNPGSLQNKVVVVAGGSNKAGKAIAEKLAQSGARVIVADVNLINAEIVVQHLMDKYKTEAVAVSLNLHEIKSLAATLKATLHSKGGVDVWVNADSLRRLQQPNEINKSIHDVFALSNEVAAYMRDTQTQGIVINIVPVTDWERLSELPADANPDEYLLKITKTMSESFQEHGIRFFTLWPVSPGIMTEDSDHAASGIDHILPDDLAKLVLYCINILARSATGKLITLNGKQFFIDSK